MPSNHANKITGRLGEDIACNFLEKLGYKILAKNYRYSRFAEIDIVAKDKDTIVFTDRKSTRLNSSHSDRSRMPSSA